MSEKKPILFLVAIVLAFFYKILLPIGQVLYSQFSDTIKFYYPMRFLEWKSDTLLPLWNPIIYSGTTLVGNIQAAMFFPLNILYAVLPGSLAINYNYIIDFLIAALSMYALARYLGLSKSPSVIASLVFVFSEQFYSRIYAGHLIVFDAIALIPATFLLLEMYFKDGKLRNLVFLSFVLGIQFLSGHSQFYIYNIIALLFYSFNRIFFTHSSDWGKIGKIFLAILFSVALASVQFIPFVEGLMQSSRLSGIDVQYLAKTAMQPEQIVSFFVPEVFGGKDNSWGYTNFWEYSAYLGPAALLLSLVALKRNRNHYVRSFGLLAALAILLSFFFPVQQFRYFGRFLVWYAFAIAIVAAFGAQAAINSNWNDSKLLKILLIVSVAALMFSSVLFVMKDSLVGFAKGLITSKASQVSPQKYQLLLANLQGIVSNFTLNLFIVSLFAVATATALEIFKGKKVLGYILIAIVLLGLLSFGFKYVETAKFSEVVKTSDATEFLASDNDVFRVYSLQEVLPYHEAAVKSIELTYGYDPLIPSRYEALLKAFNCLNPCYDEVLYQLLNVKYIVSRGDITSATTKKVFAGKDKDVYAFEKFLPRAHVVYDAIQTSEPQVLQELTKDTFDPGKTVVLGAANSPGIVDPLEGQGNAVIEERRPGYYKIKVKSSGDGVLVLSDGWAPGWRVYDNGNLSQILMTNYAFLGAPVHQGESLLEFKYEPVTLKIGAAITMLSLIVVFLGFYFRKF